MDVERHFRKTYLNMLPPPPQSYNKLTQEEREEITDYIFAKAQEVHRLVTEDAKAKNNFWYGRFKALARCAMIIFSVMGFVIGWLLAELTK